MVISGEWLEFFFNTPTWEMNVRSRRNLIILWMRIEEFWVKHLKVKS